MPMRATYMPWEAVGTLSDDELRGLLMALEEKKGRSAASVPSVA